MASIVSCEDTNGCWSHHHGPDKGDLLQAKRADLLPFNYDKVVLKHVHHDEQAQGCCEWGSSPTKSFEGCWEIGCIYHRLPKQRRGQLSPKKTHHHSPYAQKKEVGQENLRDPNVELMTDWSWGWSYPQCLAIYPKQPSFNHPLPSNLLTSKRAVLLSFTFSPSLKWTHLPTCSSVPTPWSPLRIELDNLNIELREESSLPQDLNVELTLSHPHEEPLREPTQHRPQTHRENLFLVYIWAKNRS